MVMPGSPRSSPAEWAAPESPAEAAGPVARRRPSGFSRLTPAVTQPVPVPLRPLTFGEILDGAFETIRIAPALVLGLTAMVVVPAELLLTLLDRDLLDGNPTRYLLQRPWRYLVDSGTGTGDPSEFAVWLHLGLGLIVPALVAVGIGRVLSAWYAGTPIRPVAAAEHMVRRSWVVLLLAPVRGIGALMLGVPLVFLVLTGPIIGTESAGPGEALRRSWDMVQRRLGSAFGLYLGSALMVLVLTASLNLIAVGVGELLLGETRWVLLVVANIAVSVVATAFVAAATCLLYLDSRVRIEGLDLDLLLIDSFEGHRP